MPVEHHYSLCKHQNMKKLFYNIYWNQANLAGDAAGETYAFLYAKPACLVMKSYAPFSKHQRWFWLSFKALVLVKSNDWWKNKTKQQQQQQQKRKKKKKKKKKKEKMEQNAYCHKISTNAILCVFISFQYI